MARSRKTKRQLIVLSVIIVAILIVLAYMALSQSGSVARAVPFMPPPVQKDFSRSVFDNPAYPLLEPSPIKLPLDPGPKGRENPFSAP